MNQTANPTKAELAWKHARGCKRDTRDCPHCIANIAWFRSLPLAELSAVLQEQQAQPMPGQRSSRETSLS